MLNRILSLLILVVVVGTAGLFYAAPILAFHDIRSAAESQDIQALSQLIDFDKLRQSLKSQLEAGDEGVSAPAPSVINDPLGAAGKLIKDAANSIGKSVGEMIDPKAPVTKAKNTVDVEKYLTPRAILGLTYGAGKKAPKFDKAAYPGKAPEPKMTFFSIDHARMTVGSEADGITMFTFERKGLFSWQLVHVGLDVKLDTPTPATKAAVKNPVE